MPWWSPPSFDRTRTIGGVDQLLSPEQIAGAVFETRRRGGIDPDAVTRHLKAASDTVAALIADRDALAAELADTRSALAAASEVPPVPELDEDELTAQLGQHAARVLAEARAAAEDRIAEAENDAEKIRAAAEELHAARSVEADAAAQKIRDEAELIRGTKEAEARAAAEQIVEQANVDADDIRATASMSREEADDEASRIIREAELTRRQILEDLARRRSSARRQIEQLRAGRERLLASHETVRRALDEISQELTISMSEARAAAETAGHSVSDTTIEELEAEIETARLSGLLDTGPVPVVDRPASRRAASSAPLTKPSQKSEAPSETSATPLSSAESEVDDDPASTEDSSGPGQDDTESSSRDAIRDDDEGNSPATTEPEPVEESSDVVTDETAASGDPDLAPVVSLDTARSEVETKGHPAAGREANGGRGLRAADPGSAKSAGNPAGSGAEVAVLPTADARDEEAELSAEGNESQPEIAAPDDVVESASSAGIAEEGEADSVDDLFASLRSTADDSDIADSPSPEPTKTKKTSAAKSKKSKKTSPQETEVPAEKRGDHERAGIDAAEVTRRMKRVLADEQSKVMSSLKNADGLPGPTDLLGSEGAHAERYRSAIEPHLDGRDEQAQPSLEDFVRHVRRKVTDALEGAEGDSKAAVESLRSVYREVKTSTVGRCVDDIVLSLRQ